MNTFPLSLKSLKLSGNLFTSSIPESLGQLTNLESIHLAFANITGPIPKSIGKLKKLKELYLEGLFDIFDHIYLFKRLYCP